MARQNGILKIKGTIGGMTFYKSQDGDLVREKGGVSGERIASDPAFIRTRENGAEFSAAGKAGKLFRDNLRPMMLNASDNRVTSRVTKVMINELKQDTASQRGSRTPAAGLATANGKALIKGFNFNLKSVLGSVLYKPFAVNTATGVITINGLTPINDIAFPAGATHITLTGAYANINFATGVAAMSLTNSQNLALNATSGNVTLTPTAVPPGTGIKFYLLKIEFFQMVNAVQYSLKNGSYNALAIVEVA
ncbi:MAG TPA: hypothetical protein VNB90_17395 [Cytophagaceae bacterium]|jgi:hypothetical protein|nr:hypothetical protein [Cytophagaceae bacterium]